MKKIDRLKARLQDIEDLRFSVYEVYAGLEKLKLLGKNKYLVVLDYDIDLATASPVDILTNARTLLTKINNEIETLQDQIKLLEKKNVKA